MDRKEYFTDDEIARNIKNANWKSDIKRTFQYTRMLMSLLGVWPMLTGETSMKSKLLSKLTIFGCISMLSFTFVPATLHTAFREQNSFVRMVLIGPCCVAFGNLLKLALIILRANTIRMCVKKMEKDWMSVETEDERAIMTKNATVGRGITILCSCFLYTAGMFYHAMMPIFKGTKINQFNETIRPHVYPGYDIFVDPQKTPTYEIIFFLTCVSAFVRYSITIGVSSLAAIFVSHACGQIQILILRLAKIFDEIEDNSGKEKLVERVSNIIQGHVSGLRMASSIDEALREICLIEVMAATMSICLLQYLLLRELAHSNPVAVITYVLLLLSYGFNIFIFCHIGEILQEQYETIGQSAYMIAWYRLPDRLGLALVLVIAMASYPRKLTAGRMMDLSIQSFGAIIKTSFTYLNMLRATTNMDT